MLNKKIRITFFDILVYLSLTFLCMQFFVSNSVKVRFCVYFDSLGIKHIMMIAVIVVAFISDFKKTKLQIKRFSSEIKFVLTAVAIMVFISFVYMMFNGLSNKWVEQVYFFVIPLLYAYAIFRNDYSVKRFKSIIDYCLAITSVYYTIFIISQVVSGSVSLEFNYLKSTGPFECEVAHFYLLMYIFYTFNQNYKGRFVSAVFCVLAWKRLCLICLILITIAGFMRLRNKRIKIGYIIAMAVIFTVFPLITEYMLSAEFGQWFREFTGQEYTEFSNFRYYTVKTALAGNIPNRGLGTYLMIKVPWYGGFVMANMHNDLMRLYLEVSIVGLFLYLLFTGLTVKRRFSLFVILYLFIEMSGNHLIGNGGIPYWFLAYSLIFYFNMYDRDGMGNVFLAEKTDNKPNRLKGHVSIKNGKISIRK